MEQTYTLAIDNMNCGACVGRVTKVLNDLPGSSDVHVNMANETARMTLGGASTLDAAIEALKIAGYPAQTQEVRLSISGMSCASCVGRVDKALRGVAGVTDARVNLADETATVRFVPEMTDIAALAQASTDAGYPAENLSEDTSIDRQAEKVADADQQKRTMWIAAALTLPVFILEMGGHLIPAWHHYIGASIGHQASWTIQFILTTAVLVGPGRRFFRNGVPALWRRAPNMNSLVALGAGSAWAFSTVALFAPTLLPQGTRAVYFEAAAVIVTLILLGRWFEARAKGQTGSAIQGLIQLSPRVARVKRDEDWVEVSVDELSVGDVFLLRPGERVPTDAQVLTGESRVDESMMTGEPMQVAKNTGDRLTGGTVNGHGSLTCEVTRVGKDTTLAQIIRMVQDAQGARLPIQALVDRVTLWFVPAVMAVAVVTVLGWLIFGPAPALPIALVAGVSVLIIACPCAMGLATPTSIMVGTGRAAELGVLFRQGDALQSLSDVQIIALDKTGTLTEGKPRLTTYDPVADSTGDTLLAQIAAVESRSEHPVARAVLSFAEERDLALPEVTHTEVISGKGILGTVAGQQIAIGNIALMKDQGVDPDPFREKAVAFEAEGQTVFFAAVDGVLAALLAVSDPLRPTTKAAVAALQSRGMHVAMISGDAEGTAQAVARSLGIDTVIAGVLPDGKVDALRELRDAYGMTAFVGDGINDAPVLAEADVGIAIGSGTDVAIETADVVLMSGDLNGVVQAFDLSRATLRNIRENLVWAFGYNVLLIPVAAGALYPAFGLLLSPGLAAGAMAFSSVFVLANALRLRRAGGTA
ncbi:Copper-transporting P-type ATPase ActP [Sulfitobacter noctilucae]|uniref:heavy metal translocating P-type ATPase n=1 Tax=Sulfitobacter noctilucae TaxID=1342302 RepID=UPI00046A2DFB|nr:heavy metal translocating P-type ATPase [Sulfitobacter noctilucae]KIN65808.1 Copper-transporting P-type ATPase ActP [Sulfitobacter noctilucae]